MNETTAFDAHGGCACSALRYVMTRPPLYVHCCHCRWCQRETGSAFVLNAMIEAVYVRVEAGEPTIIETPSESGRGQRIARCGRCQVAVWSTYSGAGERVRFVRVGTLDEPDACPPDIHIFTESKQPWVRVPDGALQRARFYRRSEHWPAASLARLEAALA